MFKLTVASLLALGLAFAPALAAQEDTQVVEGKALISRDAVRPGEVFKAAIILKVQPGYHINDNAPLDEFMIPTNLVVENGGDFEVVETYYPKGRRARFSYSEAELFVYEGEVVLGVLLKAKDGLASGPKSIKAAVSYQACDNTSCLPPKELAFEIAVPVSSKGSGTDIHPEIFAKLRFRSLEK